MAWPFTSRHTLTERTLTAIAEGHGAVLLGGQGVGKTALAHVVLDICRKEWQVLHLRGTATSSQYPYGCLGMLLSRHAQPALDHPLQVLQALMRNIEESACGRRTVLFVDNAQYLDPSSAMAISRLAHFGSASILVACNDLTAAPPEIAGLWKDGLLKRIDVGPLTHREAADLLEAGLHGRISRWASQGLWHASGGNPLLLQGLAREMAASGQLKQRDGIWILEDAPSVHSRTFTDTMSSRLDRMPPAEREALEIISLAGTVDFHVLQELAGASVIDSLQESAVVDVTLDHPPRTQLRNRLTAEIIAGIVPAGRKLSLLERLESAGGGSAQSGHDACAMTSWSLSCGRSVDDGAILGAAREANGRDDPYVALRLLAHMPAPRPYADAVIEEAKALLRLGKPASARTLLDRFDAANGAKPSIRQWAELALLRWALDYKDPKAAAAVRVRLQHVRMELTAGGEGEAMPPAQLNDLLDRVELGEIQMLAFDGHYEQVLERIRHRGPSQTRSAIAQLRLDGWFCEALAMTGRHRAAGVLVGELEARQDPDGWQRESGVAPRLFTARFWSGQWDAGHGAREERTASPFSAGDTADELTEGVLHVCCGRAAKGLEFLLPAVAQARVNDVEGLLPLGLAAAAYAYAMLGDAASAQAMLQDDGIESQPHPSWQLALAIEYVTALAAARLAGDSAPVEALLSKARQSSFRSPSYELLLLSSVVRLGAVTAATQLVSFAGECDGNFAQLCALFGQGIESRDSAYLLQAAELAARLGNNLFSYDAARVALSMAAETRDFAGIRAARERMAACEELLGWQSRPAALASGLTSREREIALRAARGEPSRFIAKDLSVSVRTVEGHLHRVYGKLRVNNRVDLIDALA